MNFKFMNFKFMNFKFMNFIGDVINGGTMSEVGLERDTNGKLTIKVEIQREEYNWNAFNEIR